MDQEPAGKHLNVALNGRADSLWPIHASPPLSSRIPTTILACPATVRQAGPPSQVP